MFTGLRHPDASETSCLTEGTLDEFYHCGGATVPDTTKVIIAMGIFLASTNASI